jgi:hypothetical protein
MPTLPPARCCILSFIVTGALLVSSRADEPKWTELALPDFKEPTGAWEVIADVGLDPENPKRLKAKAGKGAIYNGAKGSTRDVITKEKYADVELHIEFLIPKKSNSGVKFMGLYEVQIYDSHGATKLTGSDCGGLYPRAELKPKYHHIDEGVAPRVNAAKPAGEWQTLDVIFVAPRFDEAGKKTANARFVKVVLNDQLIHDKVELAYPTGHAWHDKEVATGPILLQADHGPVAFRNIRVRPYQEKK